MRNTTDRPKSQIAEGTGDGSLFGPLSTSPLSLDRVPGNGLLYFRLKRDKMKIVVHIRKRLNRSRSTNFYLDRSNRSNGTFCGAPETQYDRVWNDSTEPFNNGVNLFTVCGNCLNRKVEI